MSLYRTTVALSIRGDRYEKNSEVELSKDEASVFDPADLVLVGSEPDAPEEPVADVPLEDMTVPQLKDRAKELGLSTAGIKADLQERITLHLSGQTETPGDETPGEEPGNQEGEITSN
jgi:hypothetical protein